MGPQQCVAEGGGYEVKYFASEHGLSEHQARTLIQTVGNDREKLDAAAENVAGMRGKDAE